MRKIQVYFIKFLSGVQKFIIQKKYLKVRKRKKGDFAG